MGNSLGSSRISTLTRSEKSDKKSSNSATNGQGESSRVLFLLYLIHRTWNVVVDTVDPKSKRSRASQATSEDSGAPRSYLDDGFDTDLNFSDDQSEYGSQYSFCSCSYCVESKENELYSETSGGFRLSICCESELSYYIDYPMAPSACKTPPGTQSGPPSQKMNPGDGMATWPPNFTSKENQRPPVYNAEDYTLSLRKFGNRQNKSKSIYDVNETEKLTENQKSSTLPNKYSEYKSPIPVPPESECEMTLRQFGSVTDLLTKLRADLRAAFPSFVQEFVATPLDGVSFLLEVLRAIQLSQTINNNNTTTAATIARNTQNYHRRSLLDELTCLQCLSLCCGRSPEASARLGTTPVGLLPLAASATGQGIRARILALQLLTAACDKSSAGHGSLKSIAAGHSAVSEALSTLRLRCAEPVRFRLLVGMLNSGGGSGELQVFGIRFINTFLLSADTMQSRLYLQAELHQAGFDLANMTKTISSSSPWLEKLRAEIKHFDEIKIDIEKLQVQARESDRIRSQMVILERRVQIIQEEKFVLTSIEHRLQERCAELQREVFRLQGAQIETYKSLEKRPVALPRLVPPNSKQSSSENEDEGISSSETGPSLSPVPILVLPQEGSQKYRIMLNTENKFDQKDDDATIEDVIEALENIVSDAEREISVKDPTGSTENILTIKSNTSTINLMESSTEEEIVPVNLLPQPPRKSRSLAHLMSQTGGSDLDASEYGLLLIHNNSRTSFFDEIEFDTQKPYGQDENVDSTNNMHTSTNREILNVIMDARSTEDDPTMKALRACPDSLTDTLDIADIPPPPPPQQFNGVFFINDINSVQKMPKADITAALQARRVSKNLDRIESCGLDSMIDIVISNTNEKQMYFGSSINPSFKIKTGVTNAGLYSGENIKKQPLPNTQNMGTAQQTDRTRTNTGTRLTDFPSGLY